MFVEVVYDVGGAFSGCIAGEDFLDGFGAYWVNFEVSVGADAVA